jgi:hypothetical protein
LQHRLDVRPEALIPWRQARSFLSAQSKAECRADHLEALRTSGRVPRWAVGLEPLPGFLDRELTQLVEQRRHHGIEMLLMARDLLRSRARQHSNTGRAALMTSEILYREDPEGWEKAKDLLAQLVGTDRSRCQIALNKRAEYLSSHPVSDEDVRKLLVEGPRPQSTTRPSRPRSRSRSPRARNNNRRNNSNPPRTNAQPSTSTSTSNSREREPKDTRGRSKNSKNKKSGSSTRTTNNATTSSSTRSSSGPRGTPSYNNRPARNPTNTRRNMELTPAEQAVIESFRRQLNNKNNDQ